MRKDWEQLPEVIREHGFDFHWDNEKVWSLKVPVEEMDIAEIEWMLDLPFWHRDEHCNTISPKEAVENLDNYPHHKDRIMKADVSYPIDIMKNKHGRWLTLDGLHRLLVLIERGEKKIKVRKISRELIPHIEK